MHWTDQRPREGWVGAGQGIIGEGWGMVAGVTAVRAGLWAVWVWLPADWPVRVGLLADRLLSLLARCLTGFSCRTLVYSHLEMTLESRSLCPLFLNAALN